MHCEILMISVQLNIVHGVIKSESSFICKNGSRRYNEIDSPNKYSDTGIIRMVEFVIYDIYVEFGGHVYQQTVGIPMGTNCAPLVADLF